MPRPGFAPSDASPEPATIEATCLPCPTSSVVLSEESSERVKSRGARNAIAVVDEVCWHGVPIESVPKLGQNVAE